MGWKEPVAEFLHFTRRDRIAIISLIVLISLLFFLPKFLVGKHRSKPAQADTAWIAALERVEKKEIETDQPYRGNNDDKAPAYQYDRPTGNYTRSGGELFYFDPNSLTDQEWKKLGLRDKTIHTIRNYLDKGGKFRKPGDLERIYGLFPDEYERIAPYIRIGSAGETNRYKDFVKDTQQQQRTYTSRYSIIDINSADTTAFIALPGIGNKLAARIVGFRDKLGGFYSIAQVGETFGLPDSTFQKIKQYLRLENTSIRRININTATVDELKAHPYIRWALANPIIAYRTEHGPFAKVEDIKKVMAVTEDIYKRISPYLTEK